MFRFLHILFLVRQCRERDGYMLKKYFIRANTASGCVNLAENNFCGISKRYRLCGKSSRVKSEIMQIIAGHFDRLGEMVECVVSPFDIKKYDAVIVRNKNFSVADESICGKGIEIDTDLCISGQIDEKYIEEISEKSHQAYECLYEAYADAKKIHDEWEQIYISNMNYNMLNSYTSGVINRLIPNIQHRNAVRFERFFGASTPDGSVNYIDNITENLERRYFIKGRPGTGKSTFLKKLADELQKSGYDTEVYRCSFDKDSLDMVLAPQLSFCVFDSTAPHELFPERPGDAVLDFYAESDLNGTDEKYSEQLALVSKRYRFKVSEGVTQLRLGNLYDAEREFWLTYKEDMDEAAKIADKIIRKSTCE